MAIQTQHPYIDENGVSHDELIKTYSDSGYQLMQVNTGRIYDEAIDKFPTKNTYLEILPAEEAEKAELLAEVVAIGAEFKKTK